MLPTPTMVKARNHREELLRAARSRQRARAHPLAPPTHASHDQPAKWFATRRRRTARIALAAVALAAVALVLSAAGISRADSPAVVVGAHGTLAGQGYGDWLRDSWQHALSMTPDASACQSAHPAGTTVAMLIGGYSGKREHHRCSIPTGVPLYVNGLSAECSTVEKPPFHGTSRAQLRRCARHILTGADGLSATVDGHPVIGYQRLLSASPVYTFQLPRHNRLGVKDRSGRSAAYGAGLLLRGLTAGPHTIHVTGRLPSVPGFTYDVTYTLAVSR